MSVLFILTLVSVRNPPLVESEGTVPPFFVPEVSLVLVYFFTLNHELSRITPSASPVAMISFVFTFFALTRILCSFRNNFRAVKDYRYL